jgi:hypothetical protein
MIRGEIMENEKYVKLSSDVGIKMTKSERTLPSGIIVDVVAFNLMGGRWPNIRPTKCSFYAILGISKDNLKENPKFDIIEAEEEMEIKGVNDDSFKEILDFMNSIWEEYESHKKTIPVKIPEVITVESAFSGRFKATHRIVGFKGDPK